MLSSNSDLIPLLSAPYCNKIGASTEDMNLSDIEKQFIKEPQYLEHLLKMEGGVKVFSKLRIRFRMSPKQGYLNVLHQMVYILKASGGEEIQQILILLTKNHGCTKEEFKSKLQEFAKSHPITETLVSEILRLKIFYPPPMDIETIEELTTVGELAGVFRQLYYCGEIFYDFIYLVHIKYNKYPKIAELVDDLAMLMTKQMIYDRIDKSAKEAVCARFIEICCDRTLFSEFAGYDREWIVSL